MAAEDLNIPKYDFFEIVKFGPYKFISRPLYESAWGSHDFFDFLWKQSDLIFKMFDGSKEYISDEADNAIFQTWERKMKKQEAVI